MASGSNGTSLFYNDRPGTDFPSRNESVADIGVPPNKLFNHAFVVGAEDEECLISRISESSSQDQFSSLVSFSGQPEMLFAVLGSTLNIVSHDMVDQQVVIHVIL
jgi:hypothetical protein